MRIAGAIVAAVVSSSVVVGCSLTNTYPEPGIELCVGGIDEDFDGRIDCQDDCVGPCPEESDETCGNGRDDDLDGYADHQDPHCWGSSRVTLTRCSSVLGTDISLSSTAGELGFRTVVEVPDPVSPGSTVLGARDARDALIRSIDPVTGTWEGLRLDARVYLVPSDPDRTSIAFALSDFTAIISSTGAELGFTGDDVTGTAAFVDPVWRTLSVRIEREGSDLVATLEIERPGDTPLVLRHAFAPDIPVALQLDLNVSIHGAALLDGLELHRPRYDSCAPHREPAFNGSGLVAARSPEQYCAIATNATWSSTDTLLWTEHPRPAYAPATQLAGPNGPTWDPVAHRFRAVFVDAVSRQVWTTSSPDCSAWEREGPALRNTLERVAFLPSLQAAFGLLRVETDDAAVFELWGPWDDTHARVWSSPTGEAGTFVADRNIDYAGLRAVVPGELLELRMGVVGNERIFFVACAAGDAFTSPERITVAYIQHADGSFHEIARFEPSRAWNTFDRTSADEVYPLLVWDEGMGWTGTFMMNGSSRGIDLSGTSSMSGATFFTFEVAAR